jgi:outer membrane lipoprotein carrier protein
MTRRTVLACILLALSAGSSVLAAQSLNKTIEGIERHYNSLSGLRMQFEQSMEYAGRRRMVETGTLYLQRPGKMRWDYTKPEGKIAISDGTIFRMYNPNSNQVRQVALEAMTDLRAPLSFLLGRMRLRRMFRNLRIEEMDGRQVLSGEGRNAQDFFSRVEFDFDPAAYAITGIRIFGRDESVNVYQFSDEQINPTLAASMFEFKAPADAEVVPLTRSFRDVPLDLGK